MKTDDCMNRKNAPVQMTATDLFALTLKRNTRKSFLLLGVFALSFLFCGQTAAQTLEAFDPNVTGIVVYETAIQPDGKIVIGGAFTQVGGTARFAPLGAADDQPFPSDYDADGRADLAAFQPSNGNWLIKSLDTTFSRSFPFGLSTDKPVPADYDGDGRTDVAVFRDGIWYILRSQAGLSVVRFGLPGDKLVPADYDGDGKSDVAVFRAGVWYFQNSTAGLSTVNFGFAADRPIPSVYIP